MRGRRWVSLAVVAALVPVSGCGKPADAVGQRLQAALDRTIEVSRRFTLEGSGDEAARLVVHGLVEDAGRYKAQVADANGPLMEEVAEDDALAVRMLRPDAVDKLLVDSSASSPAVDALRRGSWVVDPVGAPDLTAMDLVAAAGDVVYRGLTALAYVDEVVDNSAFVEFNPDAIEYQPEEDPFPRPDKRAGVARYDSVPPPMPSFEDIEATSGRRVLPGQAHFRKMAVYVHDGRVVEVREDIRLGNRERQLGRLAEALQLPPGAADDHRAILAEINRRRAAEREPQLLVERALVLKLSELGKPQALSLPADAVQGDLSVLVNRGRKPRQAGQGATGTTAGAP